VESKGYVSIQVIVYTQGVSTINAWIPVWCPKILYWIMFLYILGT